MFRYILFFSLILLHSCSSRNIIQWETEVSDFRKNFQVVHLEKIDLPFDDIFVRHYFVYADTIVILLNRQSTDKHFLELFHLKSGKQMGAYFLYGNGPNEMLNARVKLNRNILTIEDIIKKQIAFVNLDSLLLNKSYKIIANPYKVVTQDREQYENDLLAVINPYCFTNDELKVPNNQEPRIVITDYNTLWEPPEKYYNTFPVSNGKIICNKEKDRIVFASGDEPFFEIYDWYLHPVKRVVLLSDMEKIQYSIRNNEAVPKVVFLNRVPYSFMKYCCSDSHLYLLFIGDFLDEDDSIFDFSSWVLKYDWDGNLLGSYYSDRYFESISLSSDEKKIYATTYDEKKELPILVSFNIQ